MAQIVPQPFHAHVLDNLTKQPIEFFMREGEVGNCAVAMSICAVPIYKYMYDNIVYICNSKGTKSSAPKLTV